MTHYTKLRSDTEWAALVGRFMLAFGRIESSVNELLRRKCSEGTLRFVLQLQLAQRFTLLTEQITEWDISDSNRKVLMDVLSEAKGLSHNRNLIAHNPLVLSYFIKDKDGVGFAGAHIKSEHSDKTMEFAVLERLTGRAEKVAIALSKMWIELDLAEMQSRVPTLKPTT